MSSISIWKIPEFGLIKM